MKEEKSVKIRLTSLLVFSLIIIILLGYFSLHQYTQKNSAEEKVSYLENKIDNLNKDNSELQRKIDKIASTVNDNNISETKVEDSDNETSKTSEKESSSYNKNFSKSVFNNLTDETIIVIPIWAYNNYSEITINNKHEAYWYNNGNNTFPETSNSKIADKVINAWYCPLGQDIESNACLLFLKEDGSVTYVRFYLDKSSNGVDFVNVTKEKKLDEITGISNVLVTESGFYGVMFIKEDGTAMTLPLTKLDDLTNPN